MTTITYTDHEGGGQTISWQGREFVSTVPVEVDDKKDHALIEAAKGNRFFEVNEGAKAPSYDDTIVGKGEAAARDGKPRSIPPAYRGEDKREQAAAWLFGFDKVPVNSDPYADKLDTTDARSQAVTEQPTTPVSPTQTLAGAKEDDAKAVGPDKAKAV